MVSINSIFSIHFEKCLILNVIFHSKASANEGRFFLVRWYYDCYPFFGYLCVSAEFTYIVFYALLMVKDTDPFVLSILNKSMYFIVPGCAMKQIVNIAQLCSACYAIAESDAVKRKAS